MKLMSTLALVGSGEARISDPIDCNVYAIDCPDGIVLIDSGVGFDTESIVQNTRDAFGRDPDRVLLTHAHSDHSQGAPELQRQGIPTVASSETAGLLEEGTIAELGVDRAKRDGVYPEDFEFEHFVPDRTFNPPETVRIAGREFDAIHVRGHAIDHCCFFTTVESKTVCIGGDAVLSDGSILLLNMEGSSLSAYRSDISKLTGRDIDVLLPGHGMPRLADGQESIEEAADALAHLATPPSFT